MVLIRHLIAVVDPAFPSEAHPQRVELSYYLTYLPSATKFRRLCFYRCLSVRRGVSAPGGAWSREAVPHPGGGECLVWGVSAPRGCLVPEGAWSGGVGIPACTEADPDVRILLECILVFTKNCMKMSEMDTRDTRDARLVDSTGLVERIIQLNSCEP